MCVCVCVCVCGFFGGVKTIDYKISMIIFKIGGILISVGFPEKRKVGFE